MPELGEISSAYDSFETENESLTVEQLKEKFKDAKSTRSINYSMTLIRKKMDAINEDKRRAVVTALTNAMIAFKSVEYDRHEDKVIIKYG